MAEFPPHLESFSFGAVLRPAQRQFNKLSKLLASRQRRWPRRPVDVYGADVIDSTMRVVHLVIEDQPASAEHKAGFEVNFQWSVHQLRRKPTSRQLNLYSRDLQAVESMQTEFYVVSSQAHWHCEAQWAFPRDGTRLSVPLPLIRATTIWGVLDQVMGIRFSSTRDEHSSLIIDLDDERGRIAVSAAFAFWEPFSDQLPQNVLARASDLLSPLVSEEQDGDSSKPTN